MSSATTPIATLTVVGCSVTNNSISITFSEPVDTSAASATSPTGACNPGNYTAYDPPAAATPTPLNDPGLGFGDGSSTDELTVTFTSSANVFNDGDYVLIGISRVVALSGDVLAVSPTNASAQVPGIDPTARTTRDVEDAIAYPLLTEEIGYRPSPVGIPVTGGGGTKGGAGVSNLGQVAQSAINDVLGWKSNTGDPKGFIGALTQAFTLTEVEGRIESTWVPRTYAVQTDLGGGITGAQASLYLRAKDALDQSLPLLDGLYPLDPDADPEYVKALREMARSQMTEIVKEFGVVGLPSILRIDTYFGILLGQDPGQLNSPVVFNPDQVGGTLGTLRDTYGIYFQGNPFNNSVEDEADITNFRVISDYMTSLMQTWISNRNFFVVGPGQEAFFGTQLVLISRQFTVIAETVNEVRFTLDSVFIGPAERQALLLRFADGVTPPLYQDGTPPMYLEDIFDEVEKFAGDEGPRLLRDGGKISVTNNVLPVAQTLANLIANAHAPANVDELPDGYTTARVQKSLDDLEDQILALIDLIQQVEQQVPPPLQELMITGIAPLAGHAGVLTIYGNEFSPEIEVSFSSAVATPATAITFYSAQRIDVTIPSTVSTGTQPHDITVSNPDGQSVTLHSAFTWDSSHTIHPLVTANLVSSSGQPQARAMTATRQRTVGISVGAGTVYSRARQAGRGNVRTVRQMRASRRKLRAQRLRNVQIAKPMPPTRPLVHPLRPASPAAAKAPATTGATPKIPGSPGAPTSGTPVTIELAKLGAEVNKAKKDFDTKLSSEVDKLSDKFQKFATRVRDEQKANKTQFKDITKMLSEITKMNAKISQDVNKLSGAKKSAPNP